MPLQICFSPFKEAHRQTVSKPTPVRSICLEPELCLRSGLWASGHPGSKELTKSIWCAEREKCGNAKAYRSLGFISSWRKVRGETWMLDVSCIQPPTVELRSIIHWMRPFSAFSHQVAKFRASFYLWHLFASFEHHLSICFGNDSSQLFQKLSSIQLCFNIILENIAWG